MLETPRKGRGKCSKNAGTPASGHCKKVQNVVYCTQPCGKKGWIQMSKKLLSEEEIAELKQNPHVESVSSRSVNFNAEFKQIAYEAMMHGESLASVLEMYGINTGVLGEARIRGMAERLYACADREKGFRSQRGKKKQEAHEVEEESLRKRLQRLENELAYTRQEVAFLKKIQEADTEAQRQWESKRKPR